MKPKVTLHDLQPCLIQWGQIEFLFQLQGVPNDVGDGHKVVHLVNVG